MSNDIEKEKRIDDRFASVMEAIRASDLRNQQRFEAQEKAVNAALAAADRAVVKAETAAEKLFDAVNEFRAQLKDQNATFLSRAEFYWAVGLLLTLIVGVAALLRGH